MQKNKMQKNDKAIECKKECEALAKEYAQLKRNLKPVLSKLRKSINTLSKRGRKLCFKANDVMFDRATCKELVKGAIDLTYTMENIGDATVADVINEITEKWDD